MDSMEIAASYDLLAAHWAGPGFDLRNGIAQHERALRFARECRTALDVGCGSSGRIIDLLLASGFDVEGLDISSEMLRLAQTRHPDVTFHCANICDWEPKKAYDFISAWDSIWHVPLLSQRAVLRKLCAALSLGGVLIFTMGGTEAPGETTNPCRGQPMYHATLGIPDTLQTLHESQCICRQLEYDQYPELHVYVIAQRV